jgi:hypothetical protein
MSASASLDYVGRVRVLTILVVAMGVVAGCGNDRTKYDVYMEGLQLEAAAEAGPCKLHMQEGAPAPVLSGDQIQTCLKRTEEAIALYEEAGRLGMDDVDYQRVYARAVARRENLLGMLKSVRSMERGAL